MTTLREWRLFSPGAPISTTSGTSESPRSESGASPGANSHAELASVEAILVCVAHGTRDGTADLSAIEEPAKLARMITPKRA
jgi:hypothetical protein